MPTRLPKPVRSSAGTLTGPEVGGILQAALGEDGGEVVSWRASHLDHQPGRGSTAAYQAWVRRPDGQVGEERFGAYTGTPPPDTIAVDSGHGEVAVWRFPHDPYLPGLAVVSHRVMAVGLLRRFGIGEGPSGLELRAYRPRQRAVVAAAGPGWRLFLLAVRPDRVAGLHRRHGLCTAAGVPAATSLGHTDEGVLLLPSLPGQTLRAAVRGHSEPLPSGQEVLQLLDRLPEELTELSRAPSWPERAGQRAAVVADLLPGDAERVRLLAAAIAAETVAGPVVPVHGYLSENRVQVAGGRITGLLGIDTAGPGERVDDLAGLVGNLSVLGHEEPEPARAAAIGRLGASYLHAFERTVDRAQLRVRIAAVVLSATTTPYQLLEPRWQHLTRRRIGLAERWLDSARSLAVEWSSLAAAR